MSQSKKPGRFDTLYLLLPGGLLAIPIVFLVWHHYSWKSLFAPLQTAARNGDASELNRLINHGEDIEARCGYHNFTALLTAVEWGRLECVQALLKHHANVNVRDDDNDTPLHVLGSMGIRSKRHSPSENAERARIAELLLDNGADPNSRADNDDTPLHRAVEGSNPQLVRVLISHGADSSLRDRQGYSPLDDIPSFNKNKDLEDMKAAFEPHRPI